MKEKKLILLAEDDTFVSDIYNTKLENEGYDVVVVSNGKEVLEFLAKQTPDLLLLDIMMPYMDGMEVLDEIKKSDAWGKIPIIMLTNLSEKENIKRAIDQGVNDYLIKSHFTPAEILSKVRVLLEK